MHTKENIKLNVIREILLEFIYKSPALFTYTDFGEDTKSNFLIAVHKALPNIIEKYDMSKGKFFTYLVMNIRMMAKGFRRSSAKARAAEDSLFYCCDYDDDRSYDIREAEPDYDAVQFPRALSKRGSKILLILAIKTAYSITDNQISLISSITGFDREKLIAVVEQTRNLLQPRAELRKKIIEGRNKAFFLKTRYRLEMDRMQPETAQYLTVQRQYNFQARLVNRKNNELKTRLKLVPNNTYIGEILNIPARTVARLISEAADAYGAGETRS